MCIGSLLAIIWYNINLYRRIDIEHRKYYINFIINALLAITTITIIVIRKDYYSIYQIIVLVILLTLTINQRKRLVEDYKNKCKRRH